MIAGVATFVFAFVLARVTAIRGDANGSCAPAGGCAGLARGLAFEMSSTRSRFAADRSTSSSNAARAAISAHSSGEAARARARGGGGGGVPSTLAASRVHGERTAVPPPGRGSGRARDGHRRAGFRAVIGEQRVRVRGGFGERSLTRGVARRVAAVVAVVATFETTGAMDGDAKTQDPVLS